MDDEARRCELVVQLIQTDESLQEADQDDDEQSEENERFFHHDFQDNKHSSEESERVEVQQQTHPEHRSSEGEEVVSQFVVMPANVLVLLSHCDHAHDKRYDKKHIERAVEDIPKSNVVPADFPEFARLVADESKSEDVQQAFDDIKVTATVDGVDCCSV